MEMRTMLPVRSAEYRDDFPMENPEPQRLYEKMFPGGRQVKTTGVYETAGLIEKTLITEIEAGSDVRSLVDASYVLCSSRLYQTVAEHPERLKLIFTDPEDKARGLIDFKGRPLEGFKTISVTHPQFVPHTWISSPTFYAVGKPHSMVGQYSNYMVPWLFRERTEDNGEELVDLMDVMFDQIWGVNRSVIEFPEKMPIKWKETADALMSWNSLVNRVKRKLN